MFVTVIRRGLFCDQQKVAEGFAIGLAAADIG